MAPSLLPSGASTRGLGREALDLEPGAKLQWEVRGGSVVITTERPALYELQGFIKHGPDAVTAVAAARRTRGRV